MKVLVLNPPVFDVKFSRDGRCQTEANAWLVTFPPTALYSIAGSVREKHETKLMDCIGSNISFQECLAQAEEYKPDYVIINTATPTINSDLETARRIKESTKAQVIIYGEHATARYKHILDNYSEVDYVVLSEPETPIMRILNGDEKAPGVATRGFYGGLWQEPQLDKLPFPAYDLLPDTYRFPLTGERWMFVRSGRGCPFNCIYCVMPFMSGGNVRYHSPEYMLRQFKWMADDLGIRVWMLWDELATYDRERMIRMCDLMVKEKLNERCTWFCTTRVDKFDFELAEKMHEAGCRMISFGIESGSQEVLNKNKKGITVEQSRKAVKTARDNKMKTIGHLIIGLPGSSDETEKQTIEFAKELKLDFAQFYTATPFLGSKFYTMAKENNWFVEEDWDKIEQGSVSVSYPNFPAERIEYWRRRAYREFYLRPHTIWAGLSMTSVSQLIRLPIHVLNFLKWMKK